MIDKPGGEVAVTQGGFEAALEGLQAVRGKTQWINQQVSAGKLSLDPEVAEKAAKRAEEEVQELISCAHAGCQAAWPRDGLG
ncbi:hypothetical protein [Saccharopolyspora hattusasensis]|uniref:hypothetical protein n=1 Tax=Saccharopolyspora hattusasensis TaxID=1128679 RepID=UPI003D9733AA